MAEFPSDLGKVRGAILRYLVEKVMGWVWDGRMEVVGDCWRVEMMEDAGQVWKMHLFQIGK